MENNLANFVFKKYLFYSLNGNLQSSRLCNKYVFSRNCAHVWTLNQLIKVVLYHITENNVEMHRGNLTHV